MVATQPDRWTRYADRLRHSIISPQLISGTVLVSVVISVADESGGIFDVFSITILTVLVFWVTEVYVHTVAEQRRRADQDMVSLRLSFRAALHKARGLLFAATPPLIFLLAGLFGARQGAVAYWVALWIEVLILGVIGWIAFGGRRIRWYWRLCGAVATATLGLLAVLLKILVH
ncbi:hypothetical protein [Leifsonia sp. NPDC058230]|uniref:hypothetical protein n=1 Tax=Leifsonia sp. NPDC058230 TaxID=3346391 RepID=UPI0036DCB44F